MYTNIPIPYVCSLRLLTLENYDKQQKRQQSYHNGQDAELTSYRAESTKDRNTPSLYKSSHRILKDHLKSFQIDW